MNSFRPLRALFALGLLAGSLALGGCIGFTPLYAAEGVTPKLAAIEVGRADGRLGFLVHDFLADSFVRDRNQPAIYRLTFVNREVRVPQGITISNVASRDEVDLSTSYVLTEIATNKVVTRGQVAVNVTYDVQSQPYSALSEAQDGERRAAEQAADRVRIEIATFFASPRPVPAATAPLPAPISTFSERLTASVIQSPREQATGELRPQSGLDSVLGDASSATVTPDTAQPFTPSTDPTNGPVRTTSDPAAIQTLPTTSGQ